MTRDSEVSKVITNAIPVALGNLNTMTTASVRRINVQTQSPPRHLMDQLCISLASAISDFKAYDVPNICSRIGLADGTEDEAYSSKNKYASKRLARLPWNEVLGAARKLLSSIDDFYLSEAVAKVEETNIDTITEITRRRIVSLFDKRRICTEIEEIEFLSRLWPIGKMASVYGISSRTFEDDIRQHTIANDDWKNKELLEFAGCLIPIPSHNIPWTGARFAQLRVHSERIALGKH